MGSIFTKYGSIFQSWAKIFHQKVRKMSRYVLWGKSLEMGILFSENLPLEMGQAPLMSPSKPNSSNPFPYPPPPGTPVTVVPSKYP